MFNNTPQVGQEVLNVPFGEMIKSMAFAIAEAQLRLDENSIEVAEMMGGLKAVTYELNGQDHINFEDSRVFFGKQKLSITSAVDTHNAITDQPQRQAIRNESSNSTEFDFGEECGSVVGEYKELKPYNLINDTCIPTCSTFLAGHFYTY